jgi:hypothetical protein
VLDVLYFADPKVKQKLFARVDQALRPLLVAQLRHDRFSRPPQEREPFAGFERRFGHLVDQLLVVDDGSADGMWRDPVTDLADSLFPDDGSASYRAASGYLFVKGGQVLQVVQKHGPTEDGWFLQQAAATFEAGIPAPAAHQRPGYEKAAGSGRRQPARPATTTPPQPLPAWELEALRDPWEVLGIPSGTSQAEAKKAFRALITQYHPDKVAHLGPEFRELADRKTRELLDAWDRLCREKAS